MQQDVPVVSPNNSKDQWQPLVSQKQDGKSEPLFLFHFASAIGPSVLPEEVNTVSDEEEESTLSSSQPIRDQALPQLQAQIVKVNEPTRDEQTKSAASSQPFISGMQQDVPVSPQPPHAATQANRPDNSVGKFPFSNLTSGPSASSTSLPQGVKTGAALTKSLPVLSNAQPKLANLRHQTPSRLLNSESNLSEQHGVNNLELIHI
nr:hypothetical protein [Tanacetum cinerariifolium]